MLYGTAYNGGSLGRGGVFRLNRDGSGYQIISSFNFGGGSAPRGPLGGVVEGHDGRLYGTTEWGGSANKGTIFALKKDGAGAILVGSLGWAAGFVANPDGSLLQARDGFLYGTAYAGGASNLGGVFKISTNGSPFSVLRSFGQYAGDGVEPHAGLVAHPDGRLAGTTRMGGNFGAGTLFIGNTAGTTNLIQHHFAGMGGDGAHPRSPLLFVPGGVAYGMTFGGGSNDQGTVYRLWIP